MSKIKRSSDYGIEGFTILDTDEPVRSKHLKELDMTEDEFAAYMIGRRALAEENLRMFPGVPVDQLSYSAGFSNDWPGFGTVEPPTKED